MSIGHSAVPTSAMDAHLARELGEIAWAGLVSPWGYTAVGNRTLLRWMHPEPAEGATLHDAPIVLVHGYGGSRTSWLPLELALRRAGFANVHATTYNPMVMSLHDIAWELVDGCHVAMERAETDHLHLVGHSLGGVVVRYAVQRLGLAADVRTATTVAAPHRGTPVASIGWGAAARALRPGSPLLEDLERDAGGAGVRWVAYYSDRDLIVRPESARLDEQKLSAVNVAVPYVGHIGILRSPLFLRSVVRFLVAAEGPTERQAPTPVPAEACVMTVA